VHYDFSCLRAKVVDRAGEPALSHLTARMRDGSAFSTRCLDLRKIRANSSGPPVPVGQLSWIGNQRSGV